MTRLSLNTPLRGWLSKPAGATVGVALTTVWPTLGGIGVDWAWEITIRTLSPEMMLARRYSGSSAGFACRLTAGKPSWWLRTAAGAAVGTATGSAAIHDGEWHTVRFVCDRTNATAALRRLSIYVDGVLAGVGAAIGETDYSVSQNLDLLATSSAIGDNGTIEAYGIRFWLAARLPSDEDQEAALLAYWPCDDLANTNRNYAVGLLNMAPGSSLRVANGRAAMVVPTTRRLSGDTKILEKVIGTDGHHTATSSTTAKYQTLVDYANRRGAGVVLLGDNINGSSADDAADVAAVNAITAGLVGDLHVVLGSHDTEVLAKTGAGSFCALMSGVHPAEAVAANRQSYYSWDDPLGAHCIVLDGYDSVTGYYRMSDTQLAWLSADLAANSDKHVVVFIHYRISDDYPGFGVVEAGDGSNQLDGWEISGVTPAFSTSYVLTWELTNTDTTRTVKLYKEAGKTTLVAQGSRTGDGLITLGAEGGSGITGRVGVTYTGDDTGANTLTCGRFTLGLWGTYCENSADIRGILERSGNVLLVVNGHEHSFHFGREAGIAHLNCMPLSGGAYGLLTVWASGLIDFYAYGQACLVGR